MDVHDHSGTLIAVIRRFKLLKDERRVSFTFIPITIQEAFLDEVEALACFCLMLLSDVFGSISKTCLLQEVILWTLIETWVAIALVGKQELHRVLIFSNSKLIQFIDGVSTALLRLFMVLRRCSSGGRMITT